MKTTYPVSYTHLIEGSVVYDVLSDEARKRPLLYIGHCAGRIPVEAVAEKTEDGKVVMKKINIYRTARILMDGYSYVKKSRLE